MPQDPNMVSNIAVAVTDRSAKRTKSYNTGGIAERMSHFSRIWSKTGPQGVHACVVLDIHGKYNRQGLVYVVCSGVVHDEWGLQNVE